MPELDIADAIVTRRFDLKDDRHVDIFIWAPSLNGADTYDCHYRISGIGRGSTLFARGLDGVQALHLALMAVGHRLYASAEYQAGHLTYLGRRDLCLPHGPGERPVFNDHEKADLLCEPGDICVLAMPDLRFPFIALPGEQAYRLIENLTRIADQIPVNALARKRLSNLLDGMNAYQRYYEAVCRNAGMPPAYDTADR
ncbi:hypothetical protein AEAC466_20125 [Asticcacaulis sp. AC466]|uniref:DUF6968 family protein n=1 Tax=Asticcacaulis sp. AC466 TaxID=1282362 RepID=UPI0003C41061|nr:hypothetical protein [Asticcacaulis sp. AC466]ESQ81873.1 hypothetical protein AEAC466_20125 [Asticcacaulis sp. AC466]